GSSGGTSTGGIGARGSPSRPFDLGTLRRVSDGGRRLRHDLGRDRGGTRRLPRLGLDLEVLGLSLGLWHRAFGDDGRCRSPGGEKRGKTSPPLGGGGS